MDLLPFWFCAYILFSLSTKVHLYHILKSSEVDPHLTAHWANVNKAHWFLQTTVQKRSYVHYSWVNWRHFGRRLEQSWWGCSTIPQLLCHYAPYSHYLFDFLQKTYRTVMHMGQLCWIYCGLFMNAINKTSEICRVWWVMLKSAGHNMIWRFIAP